MHRIKCIGLQRKIDFIQLYWNVVLFIDNPSFLNIQEFLTGYRETENP